MNKWYLVCSLLISVIIFESVTFLNLNNMYASLSSDYDTVKTEYQALTLSNDSLFANYSFLETNYTDLELRYHILQTDFAILQLNYSTLEANYTATKTENDELKTRYYSLSIQFTELVENFTALKNQYTDLAANYGHLQATYQSLQANYTNLESQYYLLQLNYSSLEVMYQNLQFQYNSLQSNYTSLLGDYNLLKSQYDSLQALYSTLQTEYSRYVTAYQSLRDMINQRWTKANVESFITPQDPDVIANVYRITGGWSDTSDWNEYWDDVKAMYDWVANNIEYRYDGLYPMLPYDPSGNTQYCAEMWQFANETLSLMKGDCEDQAILLCSMIRCYCNMQYFAECIWITSSTSGHVAVQIPVSGYKLVIFDPAGNYYSHDFWGNIVFNDITTEINNWLDYWKPSMGYDVYVYRIFSDYIDETFTSTSDYITWMYSR